MERVKPFPLLMKSILERSAAYSPRTYLEQFTKEAIIFKDGKYTTVPPGSGHEIVRLSYFDVEAEMYYTLHSELATLPRTIEGVKDVDIKLTYSPELIQVMRLFHYCNFASEDPMKVKEATVKPIDVLTECLDPLRAESGDRVWMVEVIEEKDGTKARCIPYVVALDYPKWGATGMYNCTHISNHKRDVVTAFKL